MGHEALYYIVLYIYIYNNSAHKCVESSLFIQWRPTPLGQKCDHLEEEILSEHSHMLLLMYIYSINARVVNHVKCHVASCVCLWNENTGDPRISHLYR